MHSSPVSEEGVDVHGLRVHYVVHGSGPTVIFVHGWSCDVSSWRFQIPVFSHRYRVIAVDLPGHGKSEAPLQEFSMSFFAAVVEAVRKKVASERIVLVGHSMGALVIREYALRYAKHLAGLVAADGPLDLRKFALRAGGMGPVTQIARERLINRMFGAQTREALRIEIKDMMLGTSASTASGVGAAMFDFASQSDGLITAPALTIYSGTPLFGQDRLTKEVVPNWDSSQIPGTGHFLMMEEPDEFNRMLAGFLQNRAVY